MIYITNTITIDESEIEEEFIHASGPGGQNVNKVATAVQLRFDINSSSLSNEIKQRLISFSDKRINKEGILIITAKRFSKQEQNRKDAVDRLIKLVQKASEKPKLRSKTKVPLKSKKQRLESKHHRSKIKQMRKLNEELEE